MAYADQGMSTNRMIGLAVAAIVHVALGYALVTGLAYEAVKKAVERVTTVDIEEPPPPEEEPPPPPEEIPEFVPPPVAPPPPINIAPAPPPIQTVTTPPPPAPVVLQVPPPPPPPSLARAASPRGLERWAARIQGDYPSRALRAEEQGVVRMQIGIDPSGRVSSCTVVGSSGSNTLDEAACRGMQRYARYNPALNAAGTEVSSTTTQSIRYVLPD